VAHPKIACLEKDALDGLNAIFGNPELLRAMNPDKEINKIRPNDYLLPLGAWAHDAARAPSAADAAQPASPFEGIVRRRKAFGT
jgi:hypothetical protein